MLTRSDEDDEGSEDESHEQDNAERLLHESFLSRRGERLNPALRTTVRAGSQGMIPAGIGVQAAGHGGVDQLVAGGRGRPIKPSPLDDAD
jgi:hypothetical protein